MSAKIIVLLIVSVCASIPETIAVKNPAICSLPLLTGMCRAGGTQWGYDPVAKKCVKFAWGGCDDGNANRFNTAALCKSTCEDEPNTKIAARNFVGIPRKCNCQCPKCDDKSEVNSRRNDRPQFGNHNLRDLPIIFPNF